MKSFRTALLSSVVALTIVFASAHESMAAPVGAEIAQLLRAGEFDQARRILRASVAGRPDAGLHAAHLEGLIYLQEGEDGQAIAVFREVLRVDPDFSPSRIELARLLYKHGDTDAATYHFESLETGSDDVGLRRIASTFLRRIEADRPYSFSGYVSMLPSTNISKGTFNERFGQFVIDQPSRETSGVGVASGVQGSYRWKLSPQTTFEISSAVDLKKFLHSSEADEVAVSGSASVQHDFGPLTARFGPVADFAAKKWEAYSYRYGLSGSILAPIGQRWLATFSVQALKQDYVELDYRDGHRLSESVGLQYAASPSLRLGSALGFTQERTQKDHLDHDDISLRLFASKEWSGGLVTSNFAKIEYHDFTGDYPLLGKPRRDVQWAVGGKIAHKRLAMYGFMPELSYEYSQQRSNVEFFEYNSFDVGVTLTKRY